MGYAIAKQRVVVTLNRRHFVALHSRRPKHCGILVCTFDPDFNSLANRIHAALADTTGQVNWLLRINRKPEHGQQK